MTDETDRTGESNRSEDGRRTDATGRETGSVDPVVDRRDVLGAIAGATLTPALAGAVQADNSESTPALPLDDLEELPADGDGLEELLDSTPADTSRFRELSWSAMNRNHLEWYPEVDYNEAGPDPLWHGQAVTQLRLVDAGWEEFGNPDTDDDANGCYRYTFQLQSMAMELVPARFDLEANDFAVEEEYGFIPLAEGLLGLESDLRENYFRQEVNQAWAEIGNEVTVQMPELPDDRGENWDGPQQHLALSARRDQDLFAAISGRAIVETLRNDADALESFKDSTAPLLDTLDEAAVANARQRVSNRKERQRDQKAMLDGTMSLVSLLAFGAVIFFSGPIAVVAGIVGTALAVAGLILGFASLFKPDQEPLPYYRGFELELPVGEDQAIAGHHVMFDAYVTPGIEEPVTFDVTSKHQRDDFIDVLSDVTWGIEIDPPSAGASEEAVWGAASIDHASTWELSDEFEPVDPGVPGTRDVATKGPLPGLAMSFDGESGNTSIEGVPVMSFYDDATFDAYDSILHDSPIETYRWAIYRVGDYTARYELESTLSSVDFSHSSWPPSFEDLTLVDTATGPTYEFTPNEEYGLRVDESRPGTYIAMLEVDDGSLSNFTYEPFLVGGVPFPYILEPDLTDGVGDVTADNPVFPAGATVSFTGDYHNPTELDDSEFETFWTIPVQANPDAQFPDPPYGGGIRTSISDDYIVRGGPDAEVVLTEPGEYEVEFRAYGNGEVYETATKTIEVEMPSTELDYEKESAIDVDMTVVNDGSEFEIGETVTLSATETEAPGPLELIGFDWDYSGDGTYVDLDGSNAEGRMDEAERDFPRDGYGFTEPGEHEFGVLAYAYDTSTETDEILGNTARTTVTVESTETPAARITRLAPDSDPVTSIKSTIRQLSRTPFWETEEHVVWFSAADSELADSATRFRWAFHDADGVETTSLASTGPTWHAFEESGTYDVDLEVWYADGSVAETTTTVHVE